MTVTLELKPEVEAMLRQRASIIGCDVADYLEKLIEKDLDRKKSVDEILAPFRKQVAESRITDDELDELVEEIREDIHQEKLAKEREQN